MKLDNCYHLKYSDYWLHLYYHTQNVSADMFFSILLVFHVELGSLHRIFNRTLYLNPRVDCSNSVYCDWVQVLSYNKNFFLFLPVVGTEPATSSSSDNNYTRRSGLYWFLGGICLSPSISYCSTHCEKLFFSQYLFTILVIIKRGKWFTPSLYALRLSLLLLSQ